MQLSDDEVNAKLSRWPIARLASIGPKHRPHQIPIVFARSGAWLWSPIDGKPKAERELARLRNIRTNPRVSLLLDEYTDDWSRLWWIRIDALAAVAQPGDPSSDVAFGAALRALQAKYPQYREIPVVREPPTLLRFEVERVRSWSASE